MLFLCSFISFILNSSSFFLFSCFFIFFFFNDTATTEIYTLSLHDALPISTSWSCDPCRACWPRATMLRSEEHTSELQSRSDLVCRLLLEKKKKKNKINKKKKKKKKKKEKIKKQIKK